MKRSFVRKTVMLLTVHISILLFVLIAYILNSYQNAVDGVEQSAGNFIGLYGNELENKLENGDRVLEQLVYDNTEYIMLQSDNESDRYYASMHLRELLEDNMSNDRYIDLAVVAEANYDSYVCVTKNGVSYKIKEKAREFVMEQVNKMQLDAVWSYISFDDKTYLYKMYVWHGRCAGVFIELDNFMSSKSMDDAQGMQIVLEDNEGNIIGQTGEVYAEPSHYANRYVTKEYTLAEGMYLLKTYTSMGEFVGQLTAGGIIVLVIIAVSLGFGVVLMRTIKKDVLEPTKNIQRNMECIKAGDYNHRIEENYQTVEFESMKYSFNKMMDEIVGLKIAGYEKQIELSESELKSIRLTLKPHFFLNALTTISSLSMQGKNDEIKLYIDALSKNVRYMFKSGFHTVELSEELRHVENYFEMQELKYPGCVFHFVSMEEGHEEWKIPQMLLHTIIENEYKYAVSMDSMLSIFIKIFTKQVEGEEMLCIEIEDDGKGYPEQIIRDFTDKDIQSKDGSRVGLWSLKKMLVIMYERQGLFTISNIAPHGCMNRFLIPKKAVHEVTKE